MGTKDESYSFPVSSKGWSTSTNPTYPPAAPWNSTGTFTRTKTRTGVAVANWRTKIRNKEDATSNMSGRHDRAFHTFGSMFHSRESTTVADLIVKEYYAGAVVAQNGRLNRRIKVPTANPTDADNLAKAKFFKKLRSLTQEFSAPTFLGELGETLRMLRKPAAALFDNAMDLAHALSKAKGRARTLKKFQEMAGGLWLEYAFGWVPLISDTESAARALSRLHERNVDTMKHVSASAVMDYDKSSTLTSDDKFATSLASLCGRTYVLTRCDGRLTETVIVRYKAGVRSQVEMTTWDKWALFGFSPEEFIPTAWELLPWSFLVDYFVNVGDVLNAYVTNTKNVVYNVRTVRQQANYFGTLTPISVSEWMSRYPFWKNVELSGNPGEWLYVSRTVSRTKASGAPSMPGLVFKLNQSDTHLGNMAALLATVNSVHPQNFRRRG